MIYHRQGRIGTYAIFLEPRGDGRARRSPSPSAIGSSRLIASRRSDSREGNARLNSPLVVARPSGGLVEPDGSTGVASICVPIATHVPHAVGSARGSRLKGEDRVAITYFGDGATSEGAFHEGATFAGVMKAPVILFCNNNQWAISTPLSAQTAAPTLADKAVGYGGCRACEWTEAMFSPCTRPRARPSRERAGATAQLSSKRSRTGAAPMRRTTTPRSTSTRSGSKRSGKTSASAAMSGISSGWASPTRRGGGDRTTHSRSCARAFCGRRGRAPPDVSLVFERVADPPASFARRPRGLRRILG